LLQSVPHVDRSPAEEGAGAEAPGPETVDEVTRLLRGARGGDAEAAEQFFAIVDARLRRMASRVLRDRPVGDVFQTTVLVHETYLKMFGSDSGDWVDRNHFFCVAARVMRSIVVDHARYLARGKRQPPGSRVELEEIALRCREHPHDVLWLDDCLSSLAAYDPDLARLVELRFFVGLSVAELAAAMGWSHRTTERELALAKAHLETQLG
jgi:RNA polymerase sigma factor (TIGR02999 family)